MTGQTCALPGCDKPPWPSVRQSDAPALACGILHHQLLMASRFNPALPHPYQAILDRNAAGLCALLCCEKAPCLGDRWCSSDHYLLWLTDFTSSLQPNQICLLPGCIRHVYVDDNAHPSQFCGWRHEQKFVMLRALQRLQKGQVPSREVSPQQPPSPASLDEREYGRFPSLSVLMHTFKRFAHSGIAPNNIRVVEDFYEKHPSEVLTEGDAWLIVRLKFTSKGRKLTTKGHYHWKQSGPRAKKSKYTGKYYTYEKRKGKQREVYQQHAESSYTMKEYTTEDVKAYSLVHLVKEKGAHDDKEKPSEHVDENACSREIAHSMLSFGNDDSSVDSVFDGLPSLNVFTTLVS